MRNIEDHSPLKRVAELISCHNESDFTCRPRADFNKLKKRRQSGNSAILDCRLLLLTRK
ncbi:hypothetical protein Plhal703r1_c11g0059751 [Plasmopara halstedii]